MTLFRRTGGRVELTAAGRRLHEYARRVLDLHRDARREVTGLEPPVAGELVIAASSILGEHLLPALLSAFGQKYPDVRVRAAVSDSMAAMEQVERGEVSGGAGGRRRTQPTTRATGGDRHAWQNYMGARRAVSDERREEGGRG